jgi:OOP family OmpA-OmpF porin
MLNGKLEHSLRKIAQASLSAALLSVVACGGQMPFSGNINVAGDPPPLPPPPPKEEPPKPKPRVEIRDNKIEISEKIHFETAKDVIQEDSFSLMDEIVQVFKDNPQVIKVSIEGNTDSDGADAYNMTLSDKRAKAVMKYLVDKGVAADRLTAVGYGETKPIASNDTEEGKAKNRRVEFHITKQDVTKEKVQVDPKTGKETVLSETKSVDND